MSSYVTPLLYRCNVMNGRADISHGGTKEGISNLYYIASSPHGPPDLEGAQFFHLSLLLATGVG